MLTCYLFLFMRICWFFQQNKFMQQQQNTYYFCTRVKTKSVTALFMQKICLRQTPTDERIYEPVGNIALSYQRCSLHYLSTLPI